MVNSHYKASLTAKVLSSARYPVGSKVLWLDGHRTADGTAWLHVQYTGSDAKVVDGWALQNRLVADSLNQNDMSIPA
jgi:hypothetical protein